ncbi:metabolite transport [Penicillium chermesinum]|uniref:Metabolite transport n=1 Tax=Penicillium chermesinum TaxID=63820 RepID=A0A9W9PFM1_9EURO|nr:metabolite transport [Penicillium chermesinum]KAJ5245804.1 metabolite transport [Penicillium chermesinum]
MSDHQMSSHAVKGIDDTITQVEVPEGPVVKRTRQTSYLDVLVQGVALFSDGYNIQVIGYMLTVLAKLYPKDTTGDVKTRLSNSILIGDIFGMLIFGYCIDRFGRRLGVILTTLFLVLGIIIATASHGATIRGMYWMMVIGRGVAGVGAGGEYAVCTSQALECADGSERLRKKRGMLVAVSTNAAIIAGFVASSIVSIIVVKAYNGNPSDGIWRICFGIGIILPLTIFIFRMRLFDSTQYDKHAIQRKVPYKLALKYYWKPLIGACTAWFLYDVIIYPFNLLAPTLCTHQFLCSPRAFIGAFLMDRIGQKQTYVLGWAMAAVFGFIIGGAMFKLQHVFPLFVVLYGLMQTCLSIGPGDCNFLVASESFPTPLRGHFLGFAAAIGKTGAAVGTSALTPVVSAFETKMEGQRVLFLIGSAISVLGTLVVWFLIPGHPDALEDGDVRFREYLEANGYDTSHMGLKSGKHNEVFVTGPFN